MKKTFLLFALAILTSCNKFREQENLVKKDLSINKKIDVSKLQFESNETSSKKALNIYLDKLDDDKDFYEQMNDYNAIERVNKKKDSLLQNFKTIDKNKFTKVHSFIISETDTTFNYDFYFNENKIYVKKPLKTEK